LEPISDSMQKPIGVGVHIGGFSGQ
jgi:hypothetical protein